MASRAQVRHARPSSRSSPRQRPAPSRSLQPARVETLQSEYGNRAVQRLIDGQPAVSRQELGPVMTPTKTLAKDLDDKLTAKNFNDALALLDSASDDQLRKIAKNSALLDKIIAFPPPYDLANVFDRIVGSTKDVAVLSKVFKARYGVSIGSDGDVKAVAWLTRSRKTEVAFEAGGIKRLYWLFKQLPARHVAKVKAVMATGTASASAASGAASQGFYRVKYNKGKLGQKESGQYTNKGDVHQGLNIFDTTAAHELAHLVDSGLSKRADFLQISGWKHYPPGSAQSLVSDLQADMNSPLPSKMSEQDKTTATKIAEGSVTARTESATPTTSLVKATYTALGLRLRGRRKPRYMSWRRMKRTLGRSRLMRQIAAGHEDKAAWKTEPRPHLKRHQYHESYSWDGWWRYLTAARKRKKFSWYQFRAPGEEFSELYAAYHLTKPKGKNVPKAFADWFKAQGLHK